MYFDSLTAFLDMGGHGFYVWLCYGFFGLFLAWNLIEPVVAHKRARRMAQRYWRRRRSNDEVTSESD